MKQQATSIRLLLIAAAITGLLVGCASTSGATPEAMSAKSHEEEAAEHAKKADEHAEKYDPNASGSRYSEVRAGSDFAFEGTEFNPTEAHNIQAQRHQRHAEAHMAAAGALRNAEEEACASIAPESRSWCPLLGPIASSENTSNGVRIKLKDGTNIEEMVERVRCHIAYGNTQGREGMDRCPLYIEGVQVEQTGPSTIELSVDGRANVRELQKRIAEHTGG
jgi:hypothetical protein